MKHKTQCLGWKVHSGIGSYWRHQKCLPFLLSVRGRKKKLEKKKKIQRFVGHLEKNGAWMQPGLVSIKTRKRQACWKQLNLCVSRTWCGTCRCGVNGDCAIRKTDVARLPQSSEFIVISPVTQRGKLSSDSPKIPWKTLSALPIRPFPICITTLVLRTNNHWVALSEPLRKRQEGDSHTSQWAITSVRGGTTKTKVFIKEKLFSTYLYQIMETEWNQSGHHHLTSPASCCQGTLSFQNRATWLIYMWWWPRSFWFTYSPSGDLIFRAVQTVCLWYLLTSSFLFVQK